MGMGQRPGSRPSPVVGKFVNPFYDVAHISHLDNIMHSAAFITLLNVLVIFMAMIMVGRARGKYGIKAPASSGHEAFDRAFRAHMNTIEQTVMFLPVLWIAALNGEEQWAHILGAAWIVGRVWYVLAYNNAAEKRSAGFLISLLAFAGLFIVSAMSVYQSMH
jgi:glutathione S-transferase